MNHHIAETSEKPQARDTRARLALLEVLKADHRPLTELELRTELSARHIRVNKTTVYRQLAQLKEQGQVRAVDFGDRKHRFELNADHHHHLVCTSCQRVDEIHVADDVSQMERKIRKDKKFKILDHSLEFFGLCQNCQ
jgi:Fur family ferric uptake transcriptional regulator